ncbi:MAG: hypothetical protein ABW136_09895, partial [Steroidobacteraceae bacterium]
LLFEGELPESRLWSGGVSFHIGEYYDGRRSDLGMRLVLKPGSQWGFTWRGETTKLDLPRGEARINVLESATEWTPNRRLGVKLIGQWDDLSDQLGVSTRLRWTPQPGRDLFLSIGRVMERVDGRQRTSSRAEALKLSWNLYW